MNVPAQTVQFEITDLQPTFLDYIQSQKDENTRTFNIQFLFEGDVLSLSGCTATATVTINNIMVEQELACEVNETNNYVKVVVNAPYSGVMAVQVTLTDGTNTLTMPRPLFVRVARDIAETAQIDDDSLGSYADVVREIVAARGDSPDLKDRLDGIDTVKADKATTLSGYGIADAYTKDDTDERLAAKANLVTSINLVDFSVIDGQTAKGLTATYIGNGGYQITGSVTNDFEGFVNFISLNHLKSGEYQVSGGDKNKIYLQVSVRRQDDTTDYYNNTTFDLKDGDKNRTCSIIARNASITYDEIIYPSVTKAVAKGVKEIEELLFYGIANVKCFGAIGDGVTDDTQSIISACKYALSAGKKVFIPSGKYACNLEFVNTKNLSIVGDGNWSSSLIPFDKAKPVIAFSADTFKNRNLYIHLQNLSIGDEGGSVVGNTGLQLHTIQSSLLDNIRIVYFDKAIDCKGAMDFEWRNVNVLHCGNNTSQIHAVSFNRDDYTSCNAIKAHGLRMERCPLFFDAIALRHCFFTNCKFEQASKNTMDGVYAFQFSESKENSFANCMFVSSDSTSDSIAEYVAAEGEHFIRVTNTVGQTNIKFIGCSFTTPDNASAHWIYGSCINIINCDFSNCNGNTPGFAFHLFGKSSIIDTTIISKTGKKLFAYDGDFNDLDVRIVLPDNINDTNKLLTATAKSVHGLFRYTVLSGQSVTDDWFSNSGGVKIESRY